MRGISHRFFHRADICQITQIGRLKDVQMRYLDVIWALIWVRILRLQLWVSCLATAVASGFPIRYASFPLAPQLGWTSYRIEDEEEACTPGLTAEVDVIVSLYNFETYREVLQKSVDPCFNNPKITFHFVLAAAKQSDVAWLESLTRNTHHKIYVDEKRIGIYAAWNLAITSGTGDFVTNLNADDLRLPHSICCQASALEQDSSEGSYANFIVSDNILEYVRSPNEKVIASDLGEFEEKTLLMKSQNFMHCAPMWRRSLHSEFGLFDDALKSSGDTDFWLRATSGGAQFKLFSTKTVVYFHNPEGLSTSVLSVGHKEWTRIRDRALRSKLLNKESF